MRHPSPVPLAVASLLAVASPAAAQTIWQGMARPEGIQLELHHPELDSYDFGGLSTVWFFGGRLATSTGLDLVADLPFAYADVSGLVGSSDAAIGAPYLGIERTRGRTLLEAGVRIPIAASNLGAVVGSLSEIVDRFGAFSSNAIVLNAAGTLDGTSASGFTHRLRAGPRFLIPTEGGDLDLIADYGGLVGYVGRRIGIEGGVTGWLLVTGDGGIGERTVHQAGVQLYSPLSDGGRIGALLRVPLDHDTSTSVDFVLGLIATIPLR